MAVDCRELRSQQIEALVNTVIDLFPVHHGAVLRQSPEGDFRVNFESPLLAIWRDCIIYLLDLRCDAPSLLAQTLSSDLAVRGAGDGVIRYADGCPAWSGKHAAATWLPKQLSCRFVASSRAIKESDWNVDGETGEIGRLILQDTVATLPVVV